MASYNSMNTSDSWNNYSMGNNKGFLSKIMRNISNLGLNYNLEIAKNTLGTTSYEDPTQIRSEDNIYDVLSNRATAHVLANKSIPYLDETAQNKRAILFEYATKTELDLLLNKVVNECVIYGDGDFCSLKKLPNSYSEEIQTRYNQIFERVYHRLNFNNGVQASRMVKNFLITGYLTYQIIWDDKMLNIIGFAPIPSWTIVPTYDSYTGSLLWIQFPDDPQSREIFLDSQIIHISYSTPEIGDRTSYLEGLIKPYNQLKILEQTRIIYNVMHANVYMKFNVPVEGLPRQQAEQVIGQMIADHYENIEWDDTLGAMTINGNKNIQYNKSFFFPKGEYGGVEMEIVSAEGHNLNESDMLKWFRNNLIRASQIPYNRFEQENGGGSIYTDADYTRDEIDFNTFINQIRMMFKEIIVKPIKLQMCMDFPELINDELFLNSVDIDFKVNEYFERWKEMNILEKQVSSISTMLSLQRPDGRQQFHIDFLIQEKLKLLTAEELKINESYWAKEKNKGEAEAQGGAGGNDFGGGGSEEFGGGETFTNDEEFGGGEEFGGQIEETPGGGETETETEASDFEF